MENHVVEIVTFKLSRQAKDDEFLAASNAATQFARTQPGFVYRSLTRAEDGLWMDYVQWDTMENAMAAMNAFPKDEGVKPMMQMIDEDTVTVGHHALMASAPAT